MCKMEDIDRSSGIVSEESSIPRTVPFLPFECVKFVSAQESTSSAAAVQEQPNNRPDLDGEEVSKFYKNVISTQSTSAKTSAVNISKIKKIVRQVQKKVVSDNSCSTTVKRKESEFFRYIQEGDVKEVAQCLRSGFSCNQRDQFGWTALMIAACAGQGAVVELLLREGADVELRNPQGLSAKDMAVKQNAPSRILKLLDPIYGKIITIKKEKITEKVEEKVSYCDVCRKEYEDSSHERSIAHLFNSRRRRTRDSTFYHIPESNRGFQMMLRDGWDKDKGLGPSGTGQKYPVKTILRKDRSCIGTARKYVPRITHFQPYDASAVERINKNKRPVLVRERTVKKRDREKTRMKQRQKEIDFRREFHLE